MLRSTATWKERVVFDVRDRDSERAEPVAWIQDLVDKVAHSTLEGDLSQLISFPSRHSTSDHYANVAALARDRLEDMGYVTWLQDNVVDGSASWNIIADREGSACR